MTSTSLSFYRSDDFYNTMKRFGFMVLLMCIFMTFPVDSMAQTSGATTTTGLCSVASWIKAILTGAAVIAVMIYVINSFFVKSSIVGDIIMYVIIGCAVAATASYFINLTGLATTCAA